LFIIFLTYLVGSAWKIYKGEITPPYPRYLYVHSSVAKKTTIRLFKSDEESHAEQKFVEAYEAAYYEDRYKKGVSLVNLNIYLTFAPCGAQEKNCVRALKKFAEDYSFELNIKAVRPYHENKKDLQSLTEFPIFCTVEAFTEDDYRDLARYLGVTDYNGRTPDMEERDEATRQTLDEIYRE